MPLSAPSERGPSLTWAQTSEVATSDVSVAPGREADELEVLALAPAVSKRRSSAVSS